MKREPPFVYLDNNATTRIAPEVVKAMRPWLEEFYGNPSSVHRFGRAAAEAVAHAREQVADLLDADPDEIIFTSCGTESDNTVLHGALELFPNKRHVVTTTVEHSAMLNPCRLLEQRGVRVTWLEVNSDSQVNLDALERAISEETALVSVMWANNETGALFPVEEIAQICRRKKVLFHSDAVQVAGKLPIHAHRLGADFLSISGHKFHAPKGIGVLYARRGLAEKIPPLILGGGQERGRRSGTENVAGIVGMGCAAALALEHLPDQQTRVRGYRDRFEAGILKNVPRLRINPLPRTARVPNTTNISFHGVEAEAILVHLDQHGICASSGSACSTGRPEPSPVLTAMGLDAAIARGSVRFSFGWYNTEADLKRSLTVLPGIITQLRGVSGVKV